MRRAAEKCSGEGVGERDGREERLGECRGEGKRRGWMRRRVRGSQGTKLGTCTGLRLEWARGRDDGGRGGGAARVRDVDGAIERGRLGVVYARQAAAASVVAVGAGGKAGELLRGGRMLV